MQVRRTYILILFLLSFLAYTGHSQAADLVWVEDSPPSGSIRGGTGEGWVWVSANPSPHSGSLAHQSALRGGMHQHFFYNTPTANRLSINPGDTLFTYVYLDPTNPPSEIMLAWNSGAGEHRAYWGANSISLGVDGTASRRYMGALPPVGQWVRLEVPANQVDLEGSSLHGTRCCDDRKSAGRNRNCARHQR